MTFDISIDRVRIQKFFEALGHCIDDWKTNRDELGQLDLDFDPKHPDEDFFLEQCVDVSIDYWLAAIEKRMSREEVIYFSSLFSPFVSYNDYTANSVWFELAFDIQKILKNPKKTWFSICFPHLNHFDPITFRSLLHVMPVNIYVVKKIFDESFLSESEMINIYFPKAFSPNPCYVFEKSTNQLYYFIPDPKLDDESQGKMIKTNVRILNTKLFAESLLDHLQSCRRRVSTKTPYYDEKNPSYDSSPFFWTDSFVPIERSLLSSISEDFIDVPTETPPKTSSYSDEIPTEDREVTRCYIVDSRDLEKLVTDHGGYPNFDLRRFILNHDRSRVYFLDSLLYPRLMLNAYCAEDDHVGQLNTSKSKQRNRAGEIIELSHKKYARDSYIKSDHITLYSEKNAIRPAPLTLIDLHNMVWKKGPVFFYHENALYTHPQQYISDVLMPKWQDQGHIPTLILPRLLQTFLVYFQLLETENSSPKAFHRLLNEWSSDRWQDQPHFYPWNDDELQDRLFLYTQMVSIKRASHAGIEKYSFIQLLLNCLHLPLNEMYEEVLSLARWVTEYAPHLVSDNPHFDSIYKSLGVAGYFNVGHFMTCLKDLKPTAKGHVLFLLNNLILKVKLKYEGKLNSLILEDKFLTELKELYKQYDQYITLHSKHDYVTEPLVNAYDAWRRLAQLLAGAGWINDVIELLYPTVNEKVEPNIGMPLADFHPDSLVFSEDRSKLISLDSARHHFGSEQVFANWAERESPAYFTVEELNAIQESDPRYHSLGLSAYETYGGEPLSLSTCLMIRFLIDRILLNHDVIDSSQPYFVKERYCVIQVTCIESLLKNEAFARRLKKPFFLSFFSSGQSSQACLFSPTVYVALTKKGVQCLIDDKPTEQPRMVWVPLDELGILGLNSKTISEHHLNEYYLNILRYLEKEKHIVPSYSQTWAESFSNGVKTFYSYYNNMLPEERMSLDCRTIEVNDEKKTFKQILDELPLYLSASAIFLIILLIDIDPDFVFNANPLQHEIGDKATGAEKKLENFFLAWRESSYQLPYKDLRHDMEVVFISLMTTDFTEGVPESEKETLDWLLDEMVYDGCINKIPTTLINAFMPILGIADVVKQEKAYVDTIKKTIYEIYYRSCTEYRREANYAVNKKTNQWTGLLLNNHLRHFVKLRDYDWLQMVYLDIKPGYLLLTYAQLDKFHNFHTTLGEAAEASLNELFSTRLMVNIKYIDFLKTLSIGDFFDLWKEIDPLYRKDVLIDYVASYGERIDDNHVVSSVQKLFAHHFNDMTTQLSLGLQKNILSLDSLVDHLTSKVIDVSLSPNRVRTLSSPFRISPRSNTPKF